MRNPRTLIFPQQGKNPSFTEITNTVISKKISIGTQCDVTEKAFVAGLCTWFPQEIEKGWCGEGFYQNQDLDSAKEPSLGAAHMMSDWYCEYAQIPLSFSLSTAVKYLKPEMFLLCGKVETLP